MDKRATQGSVVFVNRICRIHHLEFRETRAKQVATKTKHTVGAKWEPQSIGFLR